MMKYIKKVIIILILILLRIILTPILLFIPRENNRILFYGVNRNYNGNLKEMFEHFNNNYQDIKPVYLTNKASHINKEKNILHSKSILTLFEIIRSNVVIVENGYGIDRFFGILLFKSKKIQLWHGNGMKSIGLSQTKARFKRIRNFVARFTGILSKFDIVYFTSKYSYENRKKSFLLKNYKLNGQPRNDIIFIDNKESKEEFANIISRSNLNKKILLYTPTWRDEKNKVNSFRNIDFSALNKYLTTNEIILIIKFHPIEKEKLDNDYSNIIIIENDADIYKIMQYTSAMITDYSSIYFDYLLLDKPIIFFPFDKEDYLINQRDIVYNYDEITPGKQVYNTNELIDEINEILVRGNDNYKEDRKRIRDLFYKYQDNKSRERAANDILELMGLKNEKI